MQAQDLRQTQINTEMRQTPAINSEKFDQDLANCRRLNLKLRIALVTIALENTQISPEISSLLSTINSNQIPESTIVINKLSQIFFAKDCIIDFKELELIEKDQIQKLKHTKNKYPLGEQTQELLENIKPIFDNLMAINQKISGLTDETPNTQNILESGYSSLKTQIKFTAIALDALNRYSPAVHSSIDDFPEDRAYGTSTLGDYERTTTTHQSLLFNSGTLALTTIISWLTKGAEISKNKLTFMFSNASGGDIYFESKALLRGQPQFRVISPKNLDELGSAFRRDAPLAVVTAPVCLNSEMSVVNLLDVIKAITPRPGTHPPMLIIDGSLTGSDLPSAIIEELKRKQIPTVFFRSSVKLHQQGLDLVGAGEIQLYGMEDARKQGLIENLNACTAVTGSTITPYNRNVLDLLRNNNDRYLKHLGDNSRFLAQSIDSFLKDNSDLPFKVVSPYLETHPGNQDLNPNDCVPLFLLKPTLNTHSNALIELSQKFVTSVINIAAENSVKIFKGASFGHRTSRIDFYKDLDGNVSIRIAPGLENDPERHKILQVIKLALIQNQK